MPIKTFKCETCDVEFDEILSFDVTVPTNGCPKCEATEPPAVRRIIKPTHVAYSHAWAGGGSGKKQGWGNV